MKINIICVGKLQKEFKNIFENYRKKIAYYATINLIELREVNNSNQFLQIKKETELILKSLPKKTKVILCSLQGNTYTSEQFAYLINEDNMTFVIGGSHGVEERYFPEKICFSTLTFPHQMFRIILVEQIFRAFSIKNLTKYHK